MALSLLGAQVLSECLVVWPRYTAIDAIMPGVVRAFHTALCSCGAGAELPDRPPAAPQGWARHGRHGATPDLEPFVAETRYRPSGHGGSRAWRPEVHSKCPRQRRLRQDAERYCHFNVADSLMRATSYAGSPSNPSIRS